VRVVTTLALRPIEGGRYDPTLLVRYPLRPLRGGPNGIALAYAWKNGAFDVDILAAGEVGEDDLAYAEHAARGLAAIDDDPRDFLARVAEHPLLGPLAGRVDARLIRRPTVFEAFAEAVIAQLVTSEEARAARIRLWAHAGERVGDSELRAPPTAEAVRNVPSWQMHAMGIGSRRFVTLHEGAKRGVALERIRACPPEEFMEKLMSLRGVGPWTANRVAKNALAYADAVPVGDFHAPSFVTEALTGEPDGTDETMLAALEPFRPHRARVVALIERAARAVPRTQRGSPRTRVDRHRREPWRT
jgi:3-methyladenine DNA glycosylase/8-oxoguanine DNA glycosylase